MDAQRNTSGISCKAEELLDNLVDQRLLFYAEENKKCEQIFRKLNILNENMDICDSLKPICENINHIRTKLGILSVITPESIALAKAEILTTCDGFTDRINAYKNHYKNQSDRLEQEVKFFEREKDLSTEKLNNICKLSPKEIAQAEEKYTSYEKGLMKIQKKHSWLKNDEFNVTYIQKLVNDYNEAAYKKAKLEKELDTYKGLKPNIEQAKKQLLDLKNEYYKKMSTSNY